MTARHAVVLLAVCAWACDSGANTLGGSLSTFHDLGFATVRARLYSSELAMEYVRENQEVALRVSLRRSAVEPESGLVADLATQGDVTGSTQRTPLPPLTAGTLRLARFEAREGASVRGHFDARFEAGLTEVGLHGDFDMPLTIVHSPGSSP
ncbi:MAG: hypothetical protein H6744_05350 [Deltaproteobacteria bacterium]|nr:hypothetical protein [Deltaproteobacteria bacterium]MCB9786104.1 hypothetical protein [Deltaproteobacteria bacterium]